MLRVGLTGGIGTGKTLACKIFSSLGVPVIDADEIVSEFSMPGAPTLDEIRNTFGNRIVDAKGNLQRSKLRHIVFSDTKKRRRLEKILHPIVRERIRNFITSQEAPYCVICAPLLIESDMLDLIDVVVVIDCSESVQIERAKKRGGLEEAEILKIIAAQVPRPGRLAAADIVIDNSGDETSLQRQLKQLHKDFIEGVRLGSDEHPSRPV